MGMMQQVDEGPPQVGVAIFNVIQLIVFMVILAFSVYKIIRHRHAPHIANRNIHIVLTDAAMVGNAALSLTGRWIIIALRQRHRYAAYVVYCRFSLCFGSVLLAAGLNGSAESPCWVCCTGLATVNLFKMYLVVIKFREAGASVRDDWFVTRLGKKVPRWMNIDLKTTRGQNKYLLVCYLLTLCCGFILWNIGHKVCIRLCKVELPVQSSYWIFPILPLTYVVVPLMGSVVLELRKLGGINESIGLLQELRDIALSAGPLMASSTLPIMLIEFGVVKKEYAYCGDVLIMLGEWCLLYVSVVRLASPYGYGVFHNAASKTKSLRLLLKRNISKIHPTEAKLLSSSKAMQSTTNWKETGWGSTKPDLALLQLEDLASDATALTALLQVARGLLSEEAVRCAVAIMQLRHMSLEKDARQQLRSVWTTLLDRYLKEGAPYPVSIKESDRVNLCALVEKTCQRKVLFTDDCQAVNNAFLEALLQLLPQLKPVLAAHFSSLTGSTISLSPAAHSSSGGGNVAGSLEGLQQPAP